MNEYMSQYIKEFKLDKRHNGTWVLIKIEIPKDVFEEYFDKEVSFIKYFPGGRIVFKEKMFNFDENQYVYDDRVKLETI